MNNEPRRGALAVNSLGQLGLILDEEPSLITTGAGEVFYGWTGTCIWPQGSTFWWARDPRVVAHVADLLERAGQVGPDQKALAHLADGKPKPRIDFADWLKFLDHGLWIVPVSLGLFLLLMVILIIAAMC